mgnify:CR=1 FL=1
MPSGRWTRRLRVALACIGLALLSAPAVAADGQGQVKIISIGGDISQIIHGLGLTSQVVAVDTTTIYPPELARLPKVGYMRSLSAEGVLSLKPDLIIASEKAGPPTAITQIQNSGVRFLLLTDEPGFDGFRERTSAIAAELAIDARGADLIADVQRRLNLVAREVEKTAQRPKVLFTLSVGPQGAPLAAGTHTTIDHLIRLAGGQNAITEYKEYKPLTPEAAIAAAPDIILAMYRAVDRAGGDAAFLAQPQLALTRAAKEEKLAKIWGSYVLGFSPRTPDAVIQLFRQFHPDAKLPADFDQLIAARE